MTPGTFTTHGTCMIPSYTNGPFDRRPCEPHMSPWSEVRTTTVSSYAPLASSAAITVPSDASPSCCNFAVIVECRSHDPVGRIDVTPQTVLLVPAPLPLRIGLVDQVIAEPGSSSHTSS